MQEERCAGIDWASEEHALCVVDLDGQVLAGELFAHEEAGLREMIARMRGLGVVRVALPVLRPRDRWSALQLRADLLRNGLGQGDRAQPEDQARALIGEARNMRSDLQAEVRQGAVQEPIQRLRLTDAHPEFIKECKEGIARTKRGKPYTEKAIINLDSSLKRLPDRVRRKVLDDIREGELQRAVDDLGREGLSSSRIRSIIYALCSLYRWAQAREKASRNPAESVCLPANDSEERDRIATPGEFEFLLDRLEPEDALPWALAGYGIARSQEIRALEWPEVDFEHDVMLLARSDKARKSEAARRIVPIVKPLRRRLYAEWVLQGKPITGRVCPPRNKSKSGMLSLDQLQKRIVKTWKDLGLNPIGLHDSRHTAATWLDHAGVSPKVASVFMGHKAPKRQPDAAPITLRRYTHVLPGELERARDQLDAFLAERAREEADESFGMAASA